MAQMAATAGGVAIGSTVGHVVGHALTSGGDKEQPQQQQAPPAQAPSYGDAPPPLYASPGQQMYADGSPPPASGGSLENSPCGDHLKSLLMCTQSQPDISYCADISEALKQCRNYYQV